MRRAFSSGGAPAKNYQVALFGWNSAMPVRKQILDFRFRGKKLAVKGLFADFSSPDFPDIKPAAEFDKVLGDKDLDAVFLGEEKGSSVELIKKCLDAGKNVLVDGLFGENINSGDAKDIISLAQKNDKVVMFPSLKRYSPHYSDASANWTRPNTLALTKNVSIQLRDDALNVDVVQNPKSFAMKHLFPELDFLVNCYKDGNFQLAKVSESQHGIEASFKGPSGIDINLEYHVGCPVFLYKLLWNDRCVVRVEGLTYYNNSTVDYFADGFIHEFNRFVHLMNDSDARKNHLESDLKTVPKVLDLIIGIASFPNKTELVVPEPLAFEDKLRALPSLRSIGFSSDKDKVI
jgi:hypothetical protein